MVGVDNYSVCRPSGEAGLRLLLRHSSECLVAQPYGEMREVEVADGDGVSITQKHVF